MMEGLVGAELVLNSNSDVPLTGCPVSEFYVARRCFSALSANLFSSLSLSDPIVARMYFIAGSTVDEEEMWLVTSRRAGLWLRWSHGKVIEERGNLDAGLCGDQSHLDLRKVPGVFTKLCPAFSISTIVGDVGVAYPLQAQIRDWFVE